MLYLSLLKLGGAFVEGRTVCRRSRYGGMEISDARKLKALEDENRKLKKLLAETMLDASTLKEMLGKSF